MNLKTERCTCGRPPESLAESCPGTAAETHRSAGKAKSTMSTGGTLFLSTAPLCTRSLHLHTSASKTGCGHLECACDGLASSFLLCHAWLRSSHEILPDIEPETPTRTAYQAPSNGCYKLLAGGCGSLRLMCYHASTSKIFLRAEILLSSTVFSGIMDPKP